MAKSRKLYTGKSRTIYYRQEHRRGRRDKSPNNLFGGTRYVMSPPVFCHRTNNLWTISVIIKANFAYVPFVVCQYLPTDVMHLVNKKVDSKTPQHISIQHNWKDPFCEPIIAQIFSKMHGFGYEISQIVPPMLNWTQIGAHMGKNKIDEIHVTGTLQHCGRSRCI